MSEEANLNAYLERIGFAGSIAPTLQTLQALTAAHPAAIPFENLDPLMGEPVPLDRRAVEQKLVFDRRGGYCYEHNLLFMRVLRTLGYEVRGIAARVLWGQPADAITPQTHMLLAVDLSGATYLVDVGFGAATPTAPLRLRPGAEQETPHEMMRVSGDESGYLVEMQTGPETWVPLYRLTLAEQYEVDFTVGNWFNSTHPNSPFRNVLMAARAEKGRRVTLRDTALTIRPTGEPPVVRELTGSAELREVLAGIFGIALPSADRLDPALERIVARSSE